MKYLTSALSLAAAVIAQSPTAMAQDASAKAREMFIKADTNQDGALSLEEWKAAGRRDRGFAMIDADKDGKITYAELEAHRKAEFDAADTNKDGALDADELSARALARFQEKLAERTQGMLDNMDNDGSGSLSPDEMGQGPGMRNFARIDADNDGFVTKEEIQAGMKHHKKRGHGWGMDDN